MYKRKLTKNQILHTNFTTACNSENNLTPDVPFSKSYKRILKDEYNSWIPCRQIKPIYLGFFIFIIFCLFIHFHFRRNLDHESPLERLKSWIEKNGGNFLLFLLLL